MDGCFWCSVLAMKIMSWNVRGLGSFEKRREVRHLVREKKPFICCLQETKLSGFDFAVCKYLWGDESVDFSFQPTLEASGGIVSMWDTNEVEVWSSISFNHALVILGRFVKTDEHFTVFNVYAPCDSSRQQALWNNLSHRLSSLLNQNVCICGDFDAVRRVEERRSVGNNFCQARSANYNLFIEDNLLVDLPLRGRNFTWF